jgi:hypothetical protein
MVKGFSFKTLELLVSLNVRLSFFILVIAFPYDTLLFCSFYDVLLPL